MHAIILREKDLSYDELLPIAVRIKIIIGNRDVTLIITSNLEVANAMGYYGFHTYLENFLKTKPMFHGVLGVSVQT